MILTLAFVMHLNDSDSFANHINILFGPLNTLKYLVGLCLKMLDILQYNIFLLNFFILE